MYTFRSRCRSGMVAGITLLVSGLGWVSGQEPTTPLEKLPQISRSYIKKATFHLPLNINAGLKSQVREIQLFWKDPATGSWGFLQKCAPNQPGFDFEADKEGEYWFTLTMVDLAGKSVPAEPDQSQFRMCVVVDLQAPTADVVLVQAADKGQVIQVDVRDPNLDLRKTQVWYQTRDQVWRALEPTFQQPNRYCIPIQAATTGLIRVSAADLAGNTMQRDYDLTNMAAGQSVAEIGTAGVKDIIPPGLSAFDLAQGTKPGIPTIPLAPNTFEKPFSPERTPGIKPVEGETTDNVVRLPTSDPAVVHAGSTPPTVAQLGGAPLSLAPNQRPVSPVAPSTSKSSPPAAELHRPTPEPLVENRFVPDELKLRTFPGETAKLPLHKLPLPEKTAAPVSVDRQLINQLQVLLAYKVEEVGTSGVGKVEVWITRDKCKTWQKFCEDPHRKSPVAIELPCEGLYGITLVVSNGRGFGVAPPKPGDAPEAWIEADLTRPAAEITTVRAGTGEDSGAVFITYAAKDRNLGTDSVELFYSSSRDGNWQSIAKGLKNECTHRWAPPSNFGPQAFLRLVVRDLAGNTAVVETPQPVAVDDLSRPRGRLVGILPYTPEIHLDPMGN